MALTVLPVLGYYLRPRRMEVSSISNTRRRRLRAASRSAAVRIRPVTAIHLTPAAGFGEVAYF